MSLSALVDDGFVIQSERIPLFAQFGSSHRQNPFAG